MVLPCSAGSCETFLLLSVELDSCQTAGAKDQNCKALSCTNLLDLHAEIRVRANAAKSGLNFGLVCSLAATAQLWAALATSMKASGGAVLAGGSAEWGSSGSWWRLQRC